VQVVLLLLSFSTPSASSTSTFSTLSHSAAEVFKFNLCLERHFSHSLPASCCLSQPARLPEKSLSLGITLHS